MKLRDREEVWGWDGGISVQDSTRCMEQSLRDKKIYTYKSCQINFHVYINFLNRPTQKPTVSLQTSNRLIFLTEPPSSLYGMT
jgi:hypothetical protein